MFNGLSAAEEWSSGRITYYTHCALSITCCAGTSPRTPSSSATLVTVSTASLVVLCSAPSVPQPVLQSRRRPLLGLSPG